MNPDGTTATLSKFTGKDESTKTAAYVPKEVTQDGKTYYTVTAIGDSAFADHTNVSFESALSSVNLPDSIQTIGHGAFFGCSSLSNITLPEGLTTVGSGAFSMAGLTEVTLPKSLTTVGYGAFWSVPTAIQTVTYTGTETAWNELLSSQTFEGTDTVADSNPQLKTATLHCAHTVTFDKNGHGTAPDPQVVQYEGHATEPKEPKADVPTADGFTFKGWYTEPEGGEAFDFTAEITEDKTAYAQWEKETTPDKPTPPQNPDNNKPGTQEKPNEPTTPEQPGTQDTPAVEEDDTAAIGYAAAAVTAAFVGWGAYRIGSEVYLKYLLPKDVLLPQNRIQLAELLWEDAGRPAPADAAAYTDVDDTDAQQAARWAVENGLLTLPDTEKPEEFAPYRSVSYAKSARAWNKAQQLKENAAAR